MIKISRETKLALFSKIIKEPNVFDNQEDYERLMEFLSDIWLLKGMPSDDERFNDAYGDVYQHMINNDDWDYNYLFLDRLSLLESDKTFVRFIETIIRPKYRKSEDKIGRFRLLIDSYLEKDGYKLGVTKYNEDDLPIYVIKLKSEVQNTPSDIKENNIPFFVEKNPSGRSGNPNSHNSPTQFPSFVLVFDPTWNDYSWRTSFDLYYYDSDGLRSNIGVLKIVGAGGSMSMGDILPDSFTKLPDNFCSLGSSIQYYYKRLKDILGKDFLSILFALRDCAFFEDIKEEFEYFPGFMSSLIRNSEAERLLRQAKYIIHGYDLSNLYSFNYDFKPLYSNTPVDIEFNFDNKEEIPNRIYAIIGKNGTGKTRPPTKKRTHRRYRSAPAPRQTRPRKSDSVSRPESPCQSS